LPCYKAHIAVEPDSGIITDCALLRASGADNHEAVVALELLDAESSGLQVLADSAYGTAAARLALAEAGPTAHRASRFVDGEVIAGESAGHRGAKWDGFDDRGDPYSAGS
jgi:hypothetical protein